MSFSTAPDEQSSEQQAQLIMYSSTHPVVYPSSHPYFYPQHPQPSEGFPTHGVTMYQAASSSPFLFQAQGYPIYTPHSNHIYQQFTSPSRCIPALKASHSSDSQATKQPQFAITTSHSTKSTTSSPTPPSPKESPPPQPKPKSKRRTTKRQTLSNDALEKRQRERDRKKRREQERGLTCFHCGTGTTPLWRRTEDRANIVCNACGIYWKQFKRFRPLRQAMKDNEGDAGVVDEAKKDVSVLKSGDSTGTPLDGQNSYISQLHPVSLSSTSSSSLGAMEEQSRFYDVQNVLGTPVLTNSVLLSLGNEQLQQQHCQQNQPCQLLFDPLMNTNEPSSDLLRWRHIQLQRQAGLIAVSPLVEDKLTSVEASSDPCVTPVSNVFQEYLFSGILTNSLYNQQQQ
ncbi:hypothetical protein HDU79_007829 [Rhizoclosmatium sp. JEL0117]|nr:hypothetical protein HDU79_007829 [Rhizoclosmatium sp. JEL0117]